MNDRCNRGYARRSGPAGVAGFTMIEVLITLIVLALGLIGVIGLQARGQQAELESYQRGQALALLQDMVDRINTNRAAAHSLSYVTSSPVGGGGALVTCSTGAGTPAAMAAYDLCDWGNELNGAAESMGGTSIGAMLGARGCVSYDNTTELTDSTGAVEPGTGVYTVTVAWQGLAPTAAPPANLTCGQNLYPAGGTANDAYRRVVMATLRIGDLNSP
jgi:type IV pilus assembly protein PilV